MTGTRQESFDRALDRLYEERSRVRELSYAEIEALKGELYGRFLEEERYDALISYLHDQFEMGGGREPIDDLRRALQAARDIPRLHRLFLGLIPGRVQRFWTELPHAQKGLAGNMKNAAATKAEALHVMYEYFNALHQLGEVDAATRVKAGMSLLYREERKKLAKPDAREMSPELFWSLVTAARAGAGTASQFGAALTDALSAFGPKAIRQFEEQLQAELARLWSWELWAGAYIARGGCSDDGFDYFRAWIVAQGEAAVRAAAEGPERLLEMAEPVWDLQCEALLYAAERAHFERAGKRLPPVKRPAVEWRGTPWSADELPARYPELWARFNGSAAPA